MVREKPILFSGPMVNAIQDGRKTQTRRVVKPQPDANAKLEPCRLANGERVFSIWHDQKLNLFKCPYGQPGDRLWVKETHSVVEVETLGVPGSVAWRITTQFADDDAQKIHLLTESECEKFRRRAKPFCRSFPAIHMPRWASRLTLEIVSVRVERLQQITEADAVDEGVELLKPGFYKAYNCKEGFTTTAKRSYQSLWEELNAKRGYGWDTNPWVWCITFKKL